MPSAAMWMQLDIIILSEMSEKERQIPCDIIYEWNLSNDTNEPTYETERRRQWHPTPVLLPGKSHGWRSLVGCSPWSRD